MHYFQALRVLREGKRKETSQEDLTAAAKVVNGFRNRQRVSRLKRLGYSDTEIQNLIYMPPDPPSN